LAENTKQLLSKKADAEDFKLLSEHKTNKTDTEHCMRCVEVLKKQIEGLSVLVVELYRHETSIIGKTTLEQTRDYLKN
jgi:hypothetical protein